MKQSLRSRRRKVAQEIKDMLAALEEDFEVQDDLDEDLPDEDLVEDESQDDEMDEEEEIIPEEAQDEEDEEEDEAQACVKASEETPGIEDQISDTGQGGDPTVKEVTDMGSQAKKEVQKDSKVFPTNSKYVASVTSKLDKIASVLEDNGQEELAYRLDKVSDYLESNVK